MSNFKFLKARHRVTYIKLGWKYWMHPNRVWKLAHGSSPKTDKEKKVVHELLALEIIHRRSN